MKKELNTLLQDKYILAIIGDVNVGKTTTINKIYDNLKRNGKISGVVNMWAAPNINNPTIDFSLRGVTKLGLTGILSRGDQISYLKDDLELTAKADAEVIICACRNEYPDTYKAVANISWKYGYNIIWIDFFCPATVDLEVYTDDLSAKIAGLF